MGDGTTAYNQLPYFLQQNIVGDETVAFTDTSAATASTNNSTYLSNIAPANNIKTLMTNIKQLLYNYDSQLTQLNTDIASIPRPDINTRIAKVNNTQDGPISQMGFNRGTRRIYWWDEETGQGASIIAGNFRLDGTTLYIDL